MYFKMSGYLYCFSNKSYKNLYKINMTTQNIEEHLKDLNIKQSSPENYKLELCIKIDDVEKKERIVQQILDEYRFKNDLYEVSFSRVKSLFDLLKEEDIKSKNIAIEVKNKALENKGVGVNFSKKDCYDEFISTHKEFLETHKTYMDIYSKFYDWFSIKYPRREVPTLEALISNMEKRE